MVHNRNSVLRKVNIKLYIRRTLENKRKDQISLQVKGMTYCAVLLLRFTYILGSIFERGYCVLSDSVVPGKNKLRRWEMFQHGSITGHVFY